MDPIIELQQMWKDSTAELEVLVLRDEAREVFVNAILDPPAPTEAARKAARHYKEQMGP